MNEANPDWIKVVDVILKAHNNNQAKVQRATGVAQQHISAIKNGTKGERLSYKLGYALMKEYKRITKKSSNTGSVSSEK